MSSQIGRLALADVIEQGWKQLQGGFLEQLKKTIEGLLAAERDRRVAERRERGEQVYRWGFTVRKCWQTAWGALQQVRVPRLRGREEIGLLEKYQRHALQEVLFALAVGGLSQRKVVSWVRRFLGGHLSAATIGAVLRDAQEQIEGRREQRLSSGIYRALAVDGIYLRYRRSAKSPARKGVLLVVVGVREGGWVRSLGLDGGGGGEQPSVRRVVHASMATGTGTGGAGNQRWSRGCGQCGGGGLSGGGAPAVLGALVSQSGRTDAASAMVAAAEVSARVLVDL